MFRIILNNKKVNLNTKGKDIENSEGSEDVEEEDEPRENDDPESDPESEDMQNLTKKDGRKVAATYNLSTEKPPTWIPDSYQGEKRSYTGMKFTEGRRLGP